MYLSQLTLNPLNRQVQSELGNPYELHRTLTTRCFATEAVAAQHNIARGEAEGAPRLLFRLDIDPRSEQWVLLAQSQLKPTWDGLPTGYALRVDGPKEFDLNGKLQAGQQLRFRLRANPTKRLSAGPNAGKTDGPRVPLTKPEEQRAWLERKGHDHGFELVQHEIGEVGAAFGRKQGQHMRWKSVCFSGILRVIDPLALTLAVQNGIGTAKGMGFGLLSLAPLRAG